MNFETKFGDFQCDFGIQGFIGTNILRHFKTTIDFSKRSVIFENDPSDVHPDGPETRDA